MGHHHAHHHHAHHDIESMSERNLLWAIAANMALTIVQIIGGILSGSLSLVADAFHNFSYAASLLIAMVAIKIGRKPADHLKTFGYKRAETIAAFINLITLVIIGLYLCYEATDRFFNPQPIEGWAVVWVAGIALVVDVITALLTYRFAKHSMNIRAAFLHNVADALASVGVILTGTFILLYGWVWMDAFMTLVISGYVLYHGLTQLPVVIHLLMEGTPDNVNIHEIIADLEAHEGVENVHHTHIWRLDEHKNALEAHVLIHDRTSMEDIKAALKKTLQTKYNIPHSTLEFETTLCEDEKSKITPIITS